MQEADELEKTMLLSLIIGGNNQQAYFWFWYLLVACAFVCTSKEN